MKKEIHLFLIWSEALGLKAEVIREVEKNFFLRRIFTIRWKKENFPMNLRCFYSHSQKHLDNEQYKNLIDNKIAHCGSDEFCLIVFEDNHPIYEERITSSGVKSVNTNVFDLKVKFRRDSGGGHMIHSSDNILESNKDLTLLLHMNINDFDAAYPGFSNENIFIKQECLGVGGFGSIEDLFYLLNNSTQYCVLRNFESLPDKYMVEGHGDIDLLVEDLNYVVYLTGAKPVYPGVDYRVHYTIKIGDENIPFDFRYLGDNYLDRKWQVAILNNRVEFKKKIFVPDPINHFYSLLYHAYVQKKIVKEDYYISLTSLGNDIGVDYSKDYQSKRVQDILNNFILSNHYTYSVPTDSSVYFNPVFLKRENNRSNHHDYGIKISETNSRYKEHFFNSEVFIDHDIVTKVASKVIVENEVQALHILCIFPYFPKLIKYEIKGEWGVVQTKKIKYVPFEKLEEEKQFWTRKNVKRLLLDSLEILKILASKNILHRDIRPENILIEKRRTKYRLKLIDFGWSIKFNEIESSFTPDGLGAQYRFPAAGFSDCYSLGLVLKNTFGTLKIANENAKQLMEIDPLFYKNSQYLEKKLNDLIINLKREKFNYLDYKWIIMKRYDRIKECFFALHKIKSKLLRTLF